MTNTQDTKQNGSWPAIDTGPIVVGVDSSGDSQHALQWAADLARRVRTKLVLVHAISPWVGLELAIPPFNFNSYRSEVRSTVAEWAASLDDVENRQMVIEDHPNEALLNVAFDFDPALIVVGAHGQSEGDHPLLGSNTTRVLQESHHPVAVIPYEAKVGNGSSLTVGVDGSTTSERALRWAADTAGNIGLDTYAVSVLPEDSYSEKPRWSTSKSGRATELDVDSLRDLAEQTSKEAGTKIVSDALVGHPAEELIEAGADAFAIVVGRTGHRTFWRPALGSTSHTVATYARTPVILIP